MSLYAKIFFPLIAVGLITTGIYSYLITGRIRDYTATLLATQRTIKDTQEAIDKRVEQIRVTGADKRTTDSSTKETTSLIATRKENIAEAKLKIDSLESKVREAGDRANLADKDLQEKMQHFGDQTPDQMHTEIAKLTTDLSNADTESRVLDQKLKEYLTEGEHLRKSAEVAKQGGALPNISGKVVSFDRTYGYAVINIGAHEGVAANGVLHVYRGRQFVGKLRVISVDSHSSVGNPIIDATKSEIQAGDQIMN